VTPPRDDDKTTILLAKHFEGDLSPSEMEDLRAILDEDAGARDTLVRMARREALLAEMVKSEAGAPSPEEEASFAHDTTRRRTPVPASSSRAHRHTTRSRRRTRSGRTYRRGGNASATYIALGVTALAAAAALLLVLRAPATAPASRRHDPDVALVASVRGKVTLRRQGAAAPVNLSTELRPGDRLESSDDGAVSFCYSDGTTVALSEGSRLDLQGGNGPKRLFLVGGTLRAAVAKQPAGSPLRAGTAYATVVVVGTRFTLAAVDEQSVVEVDEGAVAFEHVGHGGTVRVLAGSSARATVGEVALIARDVPVKTARPSSRVTRGLVVLYELEERAGRVARDTSGNGTPMNLYVQGGMSWLDGRDGMRIHGGRLVSDGPATKVHEALQRSRAFTLETWCTPAEAIQVGPARIVTLSKDPGGRNLTLGHGIFERPGNDFTVRFRTTGQSNGTPELCTPMVISTRRTHCATTYDGSALALYLDGKPVASRRISGDIGNWDPTFPLAVGNEGVTFERPWVGEVELVAIYDRPLSPDEIETNFVAGKAERE